MEGHWVLKAENHSNLYFEFENKTVYFDDSRHFGLIEIATSDEEFNKIMKRVGYCLLTQRDKITKDWWLKQFRNKRIRKPLCDFLLDQGKFSGIGNWVRAEVLYKAKLSPHRKITELSEEEVEKLRQVMFEIVDEAYKLGGLTIATYWDPMGRKGGYECQCYGKTKDKYGNPVIIEKMAADRMIHWVKEIQM